MLYAVVDHAVKDLLHSKSIYETDFFFPSKPFKGATLQRCHAVYHR